MKLSENKLVLALLLLGLALHFQFGPTLNIIPETVTVVGGGPIAFVGTSYVTVYSAGSISASPYGSERSATVTLSAKDSSGTILFSIVVGTYSSGYTPVGISIRTWSNSYVLIQSQLAAIQEKTVMFTVSISGGDSYRSASINSITYVNSLGFSPQLAVFYRQGSEVDITVKTVKMSGFKVVLSFNAKDYTAFTDSEGAAVFKVQMPTRIGDYIAVVSGIDPWTGVLVREEFIIKVKAVTVISWDPERIAYTGETFKIRFSVKTWDGLPLEPTFLPTVTASIGGYVVSSTIKYISTGTYEVTVTSQTPGKMTIIAQAFAYGYEPSTESVTVDVVKSVARIVHNIPAEEVVGTKIYTVNVYDPRGNLIPATVTFIVDEPTGARKIVEGSKVVDGKYGLSYNLQQVGVYYWRIDVVPTGAIIPVSEKIIMNVASTKTPVSEIGTSILSSPAFSVGLVGLAVTVFIAIWRMRMTKE